MRLGMKPNRGRAAAGLRTERFWSCFVGVRMVANLFLFSVTARWRAGVEARLADQGAFPGPAAMWHSMDMIRAAKLVLCLLAVGPFGGVLKAQSCRAFDVASVKRNVSGAGGGHPDLAPGRRRFIATNQLMVELIMPAYEVSPLQISGIPAAFSRERYDIDAQCEQPVTKEQIPDLLQALLAERFHLSVHRERKEQLVYVLIPRNRALKLQESSQEEGRPVLKQNGHSFTFLNAAMPDLAGVLSQVTGRKVLDGTGLGGRYDFTLSYAPDRCGAGPEESDGSAAAAFPCSVFTALHEQLNLNLESQTRQIEFIVVDRMDRLIPN